MKILFLQPNYDAHVVHPPLGLGYLASFLRQKGHEVALFDGTLKNARLTDFVTAVENFNPGLVGISVLTRGHSQAKRIVRALKRKFSQLPVVIGGAQVAAAPKEVLVDLKADFAVIGEGEITLWELVKALEKARGNFGKIDGLAFWNSSSKIKINKPRKLIADINSLPFPAWDLMPPAQYRIAPILAPARDFPIAPIITSRGCPYNCSFCASKVIWKRKIRFRKPTNVLAEIKMLKEKYDVKEIHFADDNLTMDIARAEKICQLMIAQKINLPWQCPNGVRIDRLTLPLLRKMKEAGCYSLGLGIESGSQKVLKKNQKNLNLKIVGPTLADLKKVGIESYGFFILGLPGDTRQTIQQTIKFALNNPFDRVWFNLFTPYPGSPAFKEWLKKRDFAKIDWERHDASTAIVTVGGLELKEIQKLQKEALRRFYLRPKILLEVVSRMRLKELTTFLMSRFFSKLFRPLFLLAHRLVRREK